MERRGRRGGARSPSLIAYVDEPDTPADHRGELLGELAVVGSQRKENVGQHGIAGVVAEQVRSYPVGDPQAAGEHGARDVIENDQPLVEQRGAGRQPGPGAGGRAGDAGQLQDQADGRAPPGDVVVEVPVQPLEPAVEVRNERRDQEFGIQLGKVRGADELPQPYELASLLRRIAGLLDSVTIAGLDRRRWDARFQETVDGLVGKVQPPVRVRRVRIVLPPVHDQRTHARFDEASSAEQIVQPGTGH